MFSSLILSFFISLKASCEYRAFHLVISKKDGQKVRELASTLDDGQYPDYYPLASDEIVQYTDTWMCFGRTDGFLPPCPSPRSQATAPSGLKPQP